MRTERRGYFLPIGLIILIGIAYCALGFMIPPIGDDLGFINSFQSQNDCWYAFPRYIYRAWIWNNARMADLLNPLGYVFSPLWLQAISNGVVVVLMYWFAVRLSIRQERGNTLFAVLIIFLLTFAMRWDGIWMEYNTFYNYIWSSALGMGALMFLFSERSQSARWYWWLMLPVCFIAGSMHEALGVPMAVSLLLYVCVSPFYKNATLLRKLTVWSIVGGGLFTLSSRASYERIGSMLQPESPICIILGSSIFVLILIISFLLLFIFNKSLLRSLLHSPWIIYVSIAFVSSGFMLMSGYGGRTGWFAQLFAIIAVFQVIDKLNFTVNSKLGNICAFVLAILVLMHITAVVIWQNRLAKETRDIISLYEKSEDGVIFYDYTSDKDVPWYVIRKTHGMPDDDDTYYRYRMKMHYGDGKQLMVLPTAFMSFRYRKPLPIKSGEFILTDKYPQNIYGDTIVEIFPREMVQIEGKEYIVNRFDYKGEEKYLLSETDRDRGEK